MAERKSNRRKKMEPVALPEKEVSPSAPELPKEEKRKVYPTTVVSIGWESLNTKRRVNEELKEEIAELFYSVQKKPSSQISNIQELIEKYPDIQIFQAFLLLAYIMEDDPKAIEIATSLGKKYPDYMFGKIGYIESCILKGEFESVQKYVDDKYDFRMLFPEKGSFHIFEVLHFHFTMGRYFALTGQAEMANSYVKEIKSFDEESGLIKKLQKDIDKGSGVKFYQKIFRRFKKES